MHHFYAKVMHTRWKEDINVTEKKRLTVSFSQKIANQLEDLAKDQGLTKSGLLTVLISKEIERKESEQKK